MKWKQHNMDTRLRQISTLCIPFDAMENEGLLEAPH